MAALKMYRVRQAGERPLAAYGLAPIERFVFLPGLGRGERVLEVGAESSPSFSELPEASLAWVRFGARN